MPLLSVHDIKIRAASVDPKCFAKNSCKFLFPPISVQIKDARGDIGGKRGDITDGKSTAGRSFVEFLGSESPSIVETRRLDMKSPLRE